MLSIKSVGRSRWRFFISLFFLFRYVFIFTLCVSVFCVSIYVFLCVPLNVSLASGYTVSLTVYPFFPQQLYPDAFGNFLKYFAFTMVISLQKHN